MGDGRILHVAARQDWEAALSTGNYRESTRGRSLADEGFVHASTSAQLPAVLAEFYADVDPDDYLVLILDIDLLVAAGSPVQWDELPDGVRLPHIYGPIPVAAAVATLPLDRNPAGRPALPDISAFHVLTEAPA